MLGQESRLGLRTLLLLVLPALIQASPFIGLGILDTIEGLLGASNSSLAAGLSAFLGDHGSVIFQNGLMDEKTNATTTNCPRMAVIFARGTNEPGLFSLIFRRAIDTVFSTLRKSTIVVEDLVSGYQLA